MLSIACPCGERVGMHLEDGLLAAPLDSVGDLVDAARDADDSEEAHDRLWANFMEQAVNLYVCPQRRHLFVMWESGVIAMYDRLQDINVTGPVGRG